MILPGFAASELIPKFCQGTEASEKGVGQHLPQEDAFGPFHGPQLQEH